MIMLCFWYLTVFFVVVSGQENDTLHFDKDIAAFARFIRRYGLPDIEEFYEDRRYIQELSQNVAESFSGVTILREDLQNCVIDFLYEFNEYLGNFCPLFEPLSDNKLRSLQEPLMEALIGCANDDDDTDDDSEEESFDEANPTPVYEFEGEPAPVDDILDLVLVDWPESLEKMISTREGRVVLRQYANITQRLLLSILGDDTRNGNFRWCIRDLWTDRARYYFDARKRIPYVPHRFTVERINGVIRMGVYTFDGIEEFLDKRRSDYFGFRNRPAPRSARDRIFNIRGPFSLTLRDRDEIFNNYVLREGMTSSEVYIEDHLNQVYRILFFFLELRARGISTDEDDVYPGSLPYAVVPRHIQEIICNDDRYRDYLLGQENNQFSELDEDSRPRLREEDLLCNFVSYNEPKILTTTSTTMSTTTTLGSMSTTTEFLKKSRKGSSYRNEHGKCFVKRRKTSHDRQGDGDYRMTNEMNSKKSTHCSCYKVCKFCRVLLKINVLIENCRYSYIFPM